MLAFLTLRDEAAQTNGCSGALRRYAKGKVIMNSKVDKIEIDLGEITTEDELHTLLMLHLGFPHFYGKNWNAFWDAITGLVAMPQSITFKRWNVLQSRLPESAQQLQECLEEANTKYPSEYCHITYA